MSIKLSNAAGAVAGMSRGQIVALATVGVLGMGGSGFLVYHLVDGPRTPAAAPLSADEAKLAARSEERRARAAAEARKLHQQDLGQGYQFDAQGNLVGATADGSNLPQNKAFQDAMGGPERPSRATADIARGIDRRQQPIGGYDDPGDDDLDDGRASRRGRHSDDGEDPDPPSPGNGAVPVASMLGYSTVAGASWATRRPESAGGGATLRGGKGGVDGAGSKDDRQKDAMERLVNTVEESTRVLVHQANPQSREDGGGEPPIQARGAPSPMGSAGYFASPRAVSPGPSVSGDALYPGDGSRPAERAPQPFQAGGVGDMRIGGSVGPDQTVRQGKFLDCAVVNEIRADLVDSPVIAMVSRDFVSLDGKYVLAPAGSKLLGEAGRVQNLQQERVYIKFDRIIFPDQRSAFFPVRKVPAVDHMGAVGIEGDVDRHFFMQFGAAVMLGVLDGVGAAVQTPSAGTNPTLRDLIMARTSADFSTVISGVIQKYANVVPTVTVAAGSKMKIFFSEDVRMSPYMPTSDLAWMREPR